jgi:hypothetical protein
MFVRFFRWKWENVADILDTFTVLCILSSFFRAPITITFLSKLKNFRFPKKQIELKYAAQGKLRIERVNSDHESNQNKQTK